MRIVKMTPSGHIKDRYYAEFEDGATLKVNVALIADYSLFTGRDLTEEELEALQCDAGKSNAKARAFRIVDAKPVSKKELVKRLIEKGETEENANDAAEMLQRVGAINDAEYAAMIVRHYSARGYGSGKIKDEFFRRGVPTELWDAALSEKPDAEGMLDKMIASKLKGGKPEIKEQKKLTDMLYRRGFSWEEIKSALLRYGDEIGETDDI